MSTTRAKLNIEAMVQAIVGGLTGLGGVAGVAGEGGKGYNGGNFD